MSIDFNGVSGRLQASISLSDSGFTICGWVQADTLTSSETIFEATGTNTVILNSTGSGAIQAAHYTGFAFASGPTISAGTDWYFVALQWNTSDGDVACAYRAESDTSITRNISALYNANPGVTTVNIGNDSTGWGDVWDGRICAVKVWDRALSTAELYEESLQVLPVDPSNLVAFWPLVRDDDFKDWTSNGYNLTETGSTSAAVNPGIMWPRRASGVYTPPGGIGSQSISITQATESNIAAAVAATLSNTVSVSQAIESNVAGIVTPSLLNTLAIGTATESNVAGAVTTSLLNTLAVGQATESNVAAAITAALSNTLAVGQATESNVAAAVLANTSQSIAIETAVESNVAANVIANIAQSIAIGQAVESNVAGNVTINLLTLADIKAQLDTLLTLEQFVALSKRC